MPTLLLRFPAGRYHATPWGHHVNEGLIEWPPSPWRLLRALLATGYSALHWPADGPPPVARSLILKLADVLPRFVLPPASGAHSRHYMPLAVLDKGREKTTLVFDTWANVGKGVLAVRWDVLLGDDELAILSQLAKHLGYVGRSESWVEAELSTADVPLPDGEPCFSCDGVEAPGLGWEQVPVLAAMPTVHYDEWRRKVLGAVSASALQEPVKPPRNASAEQKAAYKDAQKAFKQRNDERTKLEAAHPVDSLACLQVTTDWLRGCGWNQPPGSRKVFYWRRSGSLQPVVPNPQPKVPGAPVVQAMLLSMATPTGNNHALPSVTRTLPQAELLHDALVAASARLTGSPSLVLRGRDDQRRPLAGSHEHAHVLPLDLDGDGHLEHILIWAPMGLDADAQRAVRSVRRTFTKGGVGDLKLAVAASGSLEDLRRLSGSWGKALSEGVLARQATRWVSLTPFIPPRYLKSRGGNSIEGQVIAELRSRRLPVPSAIDIVDLRAKLHHRFRHFIRVRRRGPMPPQDCGFGIQLEFSNPISGPLLLGYGSHFGLGIFIATD